MKSEEIYRILDDEEIVLENDEFKSDICKDWTKVLGSVGDTVSRNKYYYNPYHTNLTYRRKILKDQIIMKTEAPAYILGADFISVSFKGTPTTIYKNDARFNQVVDIIKNKLWDQLEFALNTAKAIARYSAGKVQVFDNVVTYNSIPVKNAVVNRIIEFMANSYPVIPLVNFLEKLMQNPSERSKEQLYNYLELYKLPVCEDGDFISYKSVKNDFKDHHTGKIDNSIGKIVNVPRESVSDDPNYSCHFGLHIGAEGYVRNFCDGVGIIVKVNPKDVVCVPHDSSSQKMRVCRYEVISKFGKNSEITDFKSNYAPANEQVKNTEKVKTLDGNQKEQKIKNLKGTITDSELRKEIQKVYNVKKTQGNAIFNRLFSESIKKTVKTKVKTGKIKYFVSADKAHKAYKNGSIVGHSNLDRLSIKDLSHYTRADFRLNDGWYILK